MGSLFVDIASIVAYNSYILSLNRDTRRTTLGVLCVDSRMAALGTIVKMFAPLTVGWLSP